MKDHAAWIWLLIVAVVGVYIYLDSEFEQIETVFKQVTERIDRTRRDIDEIIENIDMLYEQFDAPHPAPQDGDVVPDGGIEWRC